MPQTLTVGPLDHLERLLNARESSPDVLIVHGISTVGKTKVRHRFVNDVLRESTRCYAECDLAECSASDRFFDLLVKLAEKSGPRYKIDFYLFDLCRAARTGFHPGKATALPLGDDPRTADLVIVTEAVASVPGLGLLHKLYGVADHGIAAARRLRRREEASQLKRKLRLSSTSLEFNRLALTCFASDLQAFVSRVGDQGLLSAGSHFLFLVDHVELLTPDDLLLFADLTHAALTASFLVFSSLGDPWRYTSRRPRGEMAMLSMHMLGKEEVERELTKAGVSEPEVLDNLLIKTYGHPFSVELFIEYLKGLTERQIAPSVSEMLKLIVPPPLHLQQKVLSAARERVKRITESQLCSLSTVRVISKDVFRELLGRSVDLADCLRDLVDHSFARQSSTAPIEYRLDDFFRAVLQWHFAEADQRAYTSGHANIARFYRQRTAASSGANRSKNFRELLYHEQVLAGVKKLKGLPEQEADYGSDWLVSQASDLDFERSRIVARSVFGDFADEVPEIRNFFQKNKSILRVLKDSHETVIGYTLIMPISKTTAMLLQSGGLKEHQLRAEHILTEEESQHTTVLYLAGIAVLPAFSRRVAAAAALIRDAFEQVASCQQQFQIEEILTTVMTFEGRRLARKLGFVCLWSDPAPPGVEVFDFCRLDLCKVEAKSLGVVTLSRMLHSRSPNDLI